MYASAKTIFRRQDVAWTGKGFVRSYRGENAVYGYRPKPKRHFVVATEDLEVRSKHSNFYRLVTAYRDHAHKQADINPLFPREEKTFPTLLPELELKRYGLNLNDKVAFKGILSMGKDEGTVEEALDFLNRIYGGSVASEFNYLETEEEREWFGETLERHLLEPLDDETKVAIATEMLKSEAFDNFLAIKFVSFKRYSGEGAESMMPFFHELFELIAESSLQHVVLCAPHRGRLNLLTGMLKFPPEKLFRKLRGLSEFPEDARATGDVASHLVSSTDITSGHAGGRRFHLTMLRNPSHLEAVNPVSMGKTRGIMQAVKDGAYDDHQDHENTPEKRWSDKVLNVQVHGDAAYAGQGINQESLALSGVPHFEIGGTIHLVVNNQLGFTTPPSRGRTSRYCTDLAKMIAAPVIHVNGDDPEMVLRATRVAFAYQRKFRKDVFVDLNCFRRWGHNELDDPVFTNPVIYKTIRNRSSVPGRYLEKLVGSGTMTREEGENVRARHEAWLSDALKRSDAYVPRPEYFSGRWTGIHQPGANVSAWKTGVDSNLLAFIAERSVRVDADLLVNVHPQLLKNHVRSRLSKISNNERLDWSTAEALAFGSLLYQGYNVRLSGQDIGRGTFSHRHAMLIDQSNENIYIPLNSMIEGQTGQLELANSILSEEAVLGYEYGMSISSPNTLTIWEAQFGDFFNGAQVIIDTFVTSGETKWMVSSGLTILLPHGYDGAGPEHSSCRIERFLQLTDSQEDQPDGDHVNLQLANPTTPAQYFHLFRRQMVRNFRKPLIVVAPKILLRHPSATSSLAEMGPDSTFKPVIGDEHANELDVNKVIIVSGKHYYALENYRRSSGENNVAIIRLESLCPFPVQDLLSEIEKYRYAKLFIWSQEEPRNMGAWSFVKARFENLCGRPIKYCGRKAIAAPAVGEVLVHQKEAHEVIAQPFLMKP